MLVGKLHGFANAHEQRDPLGHGKTLLFTEAMDGNSIHVLHHQVQVALGGDAAVQQAGNVRMLQLRQNLPFLAKSFPKQIGGQRQVDKFDGHLLLKLPVRPMREINRAHAAASQQAVKLIRPHPLVNRGIILVKARLGAARCRQALFFLASLEQRPHLGCQFLVPVALGLNEFLPCILGSRKSLVEDRLYPQKPSRRLVHLSDSPVYRLSRSIEDCVDRTQSESPLSTLTSDHADGGGSAPLLCGKALPFRPIAHFFLLLRAPAAIYRGRRAEEDYWRLHAAERRSLSAQQAAKPQIVRQLPGRNLDELKSESPLRCIRDDFRGGAPAPPAFRETTVAIDERFEFLHHATSPKVFPCMRRYSQLLVNFRSRSTVALDTCIRDAVSSAVQPRK